MCWKPSVSASDQAKVSPASVFFSVGVMMKLAGAKSTRWALVTPLTSLPAMGWLPMNSTPSGMRAWAASTTPVFTPQVSVARHPAGSRLPYCFSQSSRAVGYRPSTT